MSEQSSQHHESESLHQLPLAIAVELAHNLKAPVTDAMSAKELAERRTSVVADLQFHLDKLDPEDKKKFDQLAFENEDESRTVYGELARFKMRREVGKRVLRPFWRR